MEMPHSSASSSRIRKLYKNDNDQDLGYKDHPYEGQPFLWNLKNATSVPRMTLTSLGRGLRSILGRKANFQNCLTLFLILGLVLTYLNLSHLRDLIIHAESTNCSKDQVAASGEFIKKRKFALYGRRLDSGYLKHVVEVLEGVGWSQSSGVEAGDWSLLWAHDYPFRTLKDTLGSSSTLSSHKRINHFPGSGYITNKMSLATSSLPHVPKAFQLPKQKDQLLKYAKDNPHKRFVQKSNNHRGIRISKLESLDLTSNASFVQEYISNPLLVDGHKFDIGVYTILTSIAPLRVHIYSDVLFRFCPTAYHPFDPDDLDKYVVGDDYLPLWKVQALSNAYNELGLGMKASFDAWYKSSKKRDPSAIWGQVEDAIRAVYLAKEAEILDTTQKFMGGGAKGRDYFEMVRFDFVIDEEGQVFIMEANMSPNLSSAHFPPNQELYRQVLYNLFKLVGIATAEPGGRSTSDSTQVSRKHLGVFAEECSSTQCLYDCDSVRCSLCAHCLSVEEKDNLRRAYLEQISSGDTRRVFPPRNTSGLLQSYDTSKLSKDNARHLEWFRGKCALDSAFC